MWIYRPNPPVPVDPTDSVLDRLTRVLDSLRLGLPFGWQPRDWIREGVTALPVHQGNDMPSQGPFSPSSASSVNGPGSYAWSNPTNVFAQDDTYASVSILGGTGAQSQSLEMAGCGFAIPTNATLTLVLVEGDVYGSASQVETSRLQLITASGAIGLSYDNATDWPTSDGDTYRSFTFSTSLPTPAEANDAAFGFAFAARKNTAGSRNVFVDHFRITITYTEPDVIIPIIMNHLRQQGIS